MDEEKQLAQSSVEEVKPVRQFLATALDNKRRDKDPFFYDQVVKQLKERDDEDTLWKIYIGLATCPSFLSASHDVLKDLYQAIFSYDWSFNNAKVPIAYRYLIITITSSNATMIIPAFQMLVRGFSFSTKSGDVKQASDDPEMRRQHIHKTLQSILSLTPTGNSHLFPILESAFPHKRFNVVVLTDYVSQLLHLCSNIPALQCEILDLIIRKCLELDVEIIIEDTGDVHVDEEDPDEDADMFAIDDLPTRVKSKNQSVGSRNKASMHFIENSQQSIPIEVAEQAEKLDALLLQIVQFIDRQIVLTPTADKSTDPSTLFSSASSSSSLSLNGLNQTEDRLFQQLVHIFEERILSTHKSKFVQFIIFYISGKLPRLGPHYATHLLKIFLNESAPAIKRQSAVLYLASYISRAIYIDSKVVNDIVSDLVTWCGTYVSLFSTSQNTLSSPKSSSNNAFQQDIDFGELDELGRLVPPDSSLQSILNRHETFYCAVQAACYICCFHGVEIGSRQNLSECLTADWGRIFLSPLEPLRYCLFSIRVEFLKLALYIGLLHEEIWERMPLDLIQPHLEDSKNPSSNIWNNRSNSNPLDSFFPYDPCLLRGIHYRIEPFYRHWSGVPGLGESLGADQEQSQDCVTGTDADTDMLTISRTSSISITHKDISVSGSLNDTSNIMAISYGARSPNGGAMHNYFATKYDNVYPSTMTKHESLYDLEDPNELPLGPDGWPLPVRQPRHYSVGSTGSW